MSAYRMHSPIIGRIVDTEICVPFVTASLRICLPGLYIFCSAIRRVCESKRCHFRLDYLQQAEYGWGLRIHTVQKAILGFKDMDDAMDEGEEKTHYVYVCVKGKTDGEMKIDVGAPHDGEEDAADE